mmetsp:Transcript_45694/g.82440  ORF Transcript_45694/g.82440 Transcript_45694/m.82440 type:complete len:290 (+) Transcript_45694:74-943(+)
MASGRLMPCARHLSWRQPRAARHAVLREPRLRNGRRHAPGSRACPAHQHGDRCSGFPGPTLLYVASSRCLTSPLSSPLCHRRSQRPIPAGRHPGLIRWSRPRSRSSGASAPAASAAPPPSLASAAGARPWPRPRSGLCPLSLQKSREHVAASHRHLAHYRPLVLLREPVFSARPHSLVEGRQPAPSCCTSPARPRRAAGNSPSQAARAAAETPRTADLRECEAPCARPVLLPPSASQQTQSQPLQISCAAFLRPRDLSHHSQPPWPPRRQSRRLRSLHPRGRSLTAGRR